MMHSLVIIGGGPLCTYALERLAARLRRIYLADGLRITVFEKSGEFGAGATHSYRQSSTSYMNRVASQIAFAADESNADALDLLPKELRPTFTEWARAKYEKTSDERFNLLPWEMPRRYLHGMALREMFECYVAELRKLSGVRVHLYDAEVTDIICDIGERTSKYQVYFDNTDSPLQADHILFVTGHTRANLESQLKISICQQEKATPSARYLPYPYPLNDEITEESVPPGSAVGILGLGLTAIDILLHLTEGRGGCFVPSNPKTKFQCLSYIPSGREPAILVPISPSGMFPACRPNNYKAMDPSAVGHSSLEHRSVFLTSEAVQSLRLALGKPAAMAEGEIRQLDFERHIFPLLVLEMAYVYYKSLFGADFANRLRSTVDSRYQNFLKEGCSARDAGIEYLLEPIQKCFEEVAIYVDSVLSGKTPPEYVRHFEKTDAFEIYLSTIDDETDQQLSCWGHASRAQAHRFCWQSLFYPLSDAKDGVEWQQRLITYMYKDLMAAAQGNLRNPVKAACDGVWRDLRSVLSEVVDFGGLTAGSHRTFTETYLRFYGRMSNGIGLEPMSKILALIEAGLIDMSVGPSPVVKLTPDHRSFCITGMQTLTQKQVDILMEGRMHAFNPEHEAGPLYRNLFRRGFIRRWRNPGPHRSEDFYPGGLDLTRSFHPVQADGTVADRLTILGVPAEGVAFFQLSAARPQSNSAILNNIVRWANEFVQAIQPTPSIQTAPSTKPAPASGDRLSITSFRSRIRSLVQAQKEDNRKDIVILAIDGIPFHLAAELWTHAEVAKMRSIFPPTSSTAWLSSLTGAGLEQHGIPGVVFRISEGELINVFEYQGELHFPATGNIFTDAAEAGYTPISIMGDWEPYDCAWRNALLSYSEPITGYRFYTDPSLQDGAALRQRIMRALSESLARRSLAPRRLIWCFIDADRHIHTRGYDDNLIHFLKQIDELAIELVKKHMIVIAHSDHGLVPTCHNGDIQRFLCQLKDRYNCTLGGAGRTRWFYTDKDKTSDLHSTLTKFLPKTIRVCQADDVFAAGTLARSRIGDTIIIAEGEEFVTFSGHKYDHGSLTEAELYVPFAQWTTG